MKKYVKSSKGIVESSYDMFGMDDGFWTKDDLMEFSDVVEDTLSSMYGNDAPRFYDGWIENNVMHLTFEDSEGFSYDHEVKIDMRKIKKPMDLQKYVPSFVNAFSDQYDQYQAEMEMYR